MAAFFVFLIILLILFALPIALSLGMVGLLSYIVSGSNLINFHSQMTDGLVSFVILAIPLFILTGEILASSAVAGRLIDFASAMVGWLSGGLAHANIVTSMLFANVSGSAVAAAPFLRDKIRVRYQSAIIAFSSSSGVEHGSSPFF